MRNLAISLLLADSAKAQKGAGKKDGPMARDYAVPAPILIADAWSSGGCSDATVTAANTKVTTADAAWKKLVAEKVATQDAAVTTAVAEKKTAVDAVLAKDTAMKADVAADDTKQQAELTLKQALDTATYAKTAAVADAGAKATAKTAADTAKAAGLLTQSAMNTAATSALTHYTAEQGQTAAKKVARGTAESGYNTENNKTANLQTLYNTAKGLYDTKKVTWDADTITKSTAAAIKTKINAVLVTATAALQSGNSGTVAKALADENGVLTTKLSALASAATAWQTEGKKVTAARKIWATSPETWGTAVHANKGCANGTEGGDQSPKVSDEAGCKTACTNKKAWGTDSNTLPEAVSGSATDYCYGYSYKDGDKTCKLIIGNLSTLAQGAGGDIGTICQKRIKSTNGSAYVTALALAKSDVTLHTTYLTKIGEWNTQGGVVATAQGKVNVATEYKNKVDTDNTARNTASTTANSAYTTTNTALTTLNTDMGTKKGNLDTNVALVATKLADWNKLKAEVTAQEAEEAAQLAIKNLADGDKSTQDGNVTALGTAATAAATAKTTADTLVTTTTTAETTAQTAYNTGVTAAAATATALATPLADLATLRGTAATKTTALTTAIANQTAQAALIVTSAGALGTAKSELLAAVVACKEAEFDKYKKTLATAEATRAANLKTIETLVAQQKAAAPARGKAGARCEKALSNGTMRPKRGEGTCDTGLCCGAAKVPVGKAMMTIETCQTTATKKYSYSAPRAPMQTTPTTGADYDFVCIQGAKKVAATASALAAALYMMA